MEFTPWRWAALGAALWTVPFCATGTGPKTVVVPDKRSAEYSQFHYAPAVRVGDLVVLSGIPAGGPGTYAEQIRRMFGAVASTLETAGVTMEDVIEIQTFHIGGKDQASFQREIEAFLPVHGEFFKSHYPAWTAIGNAVLLAPGAVVEMRVVAVAGSGGNPSKVQSIAR